MKEHFGVARNDQTTISKMDTVPTNQRNMQNLHIPPPLTATTKDSLAVRQVGKRQVSHQIKYHDL